MTLKLAQAAFARFVPKNISILYFQNNARRTHSRNLLNKDVREEAHQNIDRKLSSLSLQKNAAYTPHHNILTTTVVI